MRQIARTARYILFFNKGGDAMLTNFIVCAIVIACASITLFLVTKPEKKED